MRSNELSITLNETLDATWIATFGATSVGAWDAAATVREVVLDATENAAADDALEELVNEI